MIGFKEMTKNIRNVETLVAEVQSGASLKYVFFWKHQSQREGQIDKACCSQWWPAGFEVAGVFYKTAEHYMMAEKARLFADKKMEQQILAANHPHEAKKLGQMVRGFNEATWVQHRFEIVVQGNVAKFGQNEPLKQFLLGTGDRVLVEASPMDRIWGIGLAESDPGVADPQQWCGLNLLGFALMEARSRLQLV